MSGLQTYAPFRLAARWLTVFAVLCSAYAAAQEGVDGALTVTVANTVLNQYGVLGANAAAGNTSFTVTSIADLTSASYGALAAGDLVMLYQPQGATINGTDTANFGAVTSLGNAGRYEVITVGSVSGNTITLDASCGGLDFSYATTGNTQVIRIPQLTTLTVNAGASVTGTAWNGVRGGVVAVHAQSVVLNGSVNGTALGFRGGAADNLSFTTDVALYRSTDGNNGGEKGESIAGYQATYDAFGGRFGRGAPANGGGGGNAHNAGGGGGSNGNNGATWSGQGIKDPNAAYASAWALDPGNLSMTTGSGGGRGGHTWSANDQNAGAVAPGDALWGGNNRRERGGLGGRPLSNDAAGRIFLGGGGGAGDANNNLGAAGGRGGGMVLIVSNTVSGSGTITANGANGGSIAGTANDAASGAGGGGSVVVQATTLGGISIQANGGVGGNIAAVANEGEGPGGGGGGGFIATSGGTVTTSAAGGNNGTTAQTQLSEFPPNGATRGATGQTGASAANVPCCTLELGGVSGTIFSDTNRSGAFDTGEPSFTAATATVTLTNTTTGQIFTTTTATGSYNFGNTIPVGTYSVTASASGYSVTTPARTVTVTLNTAATVQAIGLVQNLTLAPCSTIYAGGLGSNATTPTAPYSIFPVDTTTGLAQPKLFDVTIDGTAVQTAAFARDPVTNRLYFIEVASAATANPRVGYIDLVTGQVFNAGTITKAVADQVANSNFTRFGFNAAGVGYASMSATNAVYQINTSPFSATRIGAISSSVLPTGASGDFAITAANRAWLSANGDIYRINLDDLSAVQIINTNNTAANGVAFDASGNLIVSNTTKLVRVNMATLAFEDIGTGFGGTLLSADLANCINPTLVPNLSVVKTVSPTGSVAPGTVLTYTITTTNTGNAISVNTTFTDAIPANTTYVTGSTTLNGTAVTDATGGVMPYVAGGLIKSPSFTPPTGSPITYNDGIVSSSAPAVVTFQVRVDNPLPANVTAISNQGTVVYDAGTGNTTISVPSAPTAGGSGATVTNVGGRDFGDAPDTAAGTSAGNYQTLASDGGPSHTITAALRLGSAVTDADGGTLQNTAATADDLNATDDEDGVATFPVITTAAAQTVTVPVSLSNTTGAAATLVGFLDFNKDGDFADLNEIAPSVTVAAGATSANVVFTTPTGLTAGTTYARFRISSTTTEVASAVGAASSGEVEDYQVTIGSPDLTIAKTHTGNFVRGSTGVYTLTVGNSGNQPSSGTITVTDTLPTGFTVNGGAAGTVTPGGTNAANWSCTSNAASPQVVTCTSTTAVPVGGNSSFTLTVNVAANAGSPLVNSAAVAGGGEAAANNGNNTVNDSTVTVAPADLTLSKADTGNFTVGGTGTYSFTVNNAGGAASTGTITVTDTLPAGLTYAGSVGGTNGANWSCSAAGQTVTCTSSTAISAAGSSTFTFNVSVGTGTAPGTNSITNTAAVSGGGDANTGNNSASDPTTVLSPNLTITKTHSGDFVRGTTGTYTITLGNSGTASTSGTITVTDTLPTGLSVPAGSVALTGANAAAWSCSASGQTITCTSTAAIAVAGSSTFSFSVNVLASAPASVTNTATVTGGNEATANAGNNTADDPTTTVGSADLTLSKTASSTFVRGSTGTYTLTVTNSGDAASSGTITVTDVLPTGLSYSGFSGAGWSCSASGQTVTCTTSSALAVGATSSVELTVNIATTAPTSIDNTATVSGGGELNTGNNSSTATTPTVNAGSLVLSKTVRNITQSGTSETANQGGPGDVLEYCISYSNPGQSQVTGAVMNDTIPPRTAAETAVGDYAGAAIRWRVTAPTSSTQNLSAAVADDAGELSAALTVRLGTIPSGGAGDVCFRVSIDD